MISIVENDAAPEEINHHQKGVKFLYDVGVSKVPTKYILPLSIQAAPTTLSAAAVDEKKLHLKLPVIDFSELLQASRRSKVLRSLANACETFGLFHVVNHGIPLQVTSNMRKAGSGFFDLPFEERSKFMTSNVHSPVRYGTSFNQNLDTVFCWRDFLKLMCHPMSDVLPHWPSSPADFRITTLAYSKEVQSLFATLMEAVLESLGLASMSQEEEEDGIMMKNLQEGGSQMMVVNCYPPCPEPHLTLGLPPHSDFGLLTLLLQDDEVEGLQIKHGHEWIAVHPISDSFVVNVGDHLEILSNGKYKSVLHRVVVNKAVKCRISVASVHTLPLDSEVRPSSKLIDDANPCRFNPTNFNQFLDYLSSSQSTTQSFLDTIRKFP